MNEPERRLKGVNLGGWLLKEAYILGGRNIPESEFRGKFKKIHGLKELESFDNFFKTNFVTEQDFRNISTWEANCVRVPFHYRLIEKSPFKYSEEGFLYLEKALSWAQKYNLKIILDLHAAPGSQNSDWHSDSSGIPFLWEKTAYRERTVALWEKIADRFKDRSSLYGYDLLNEPVVGKGKLKILHGFYRKLVARIQNIDKNKKLYLEGNLWAQEIDFLKDLIDENVRISIHSYQPLNFTFNFIPYYKYPGVIDGGKWDKNAVYKYLEPYYKFSRKNKVEILVGEFGINWRNNFYGEADYLRNILDAFEDFGFSYTYWTYKTVKNYVFPDGIYQYIDNPCFVCRQGPVSGWESYYSLWGKKKRDIVRSWRTDNFELNKGVVNILKKYFSV